MNLFNKLHVMAMAGAMLFAATVMPAMAQQVDTLERVKENGVIRVGVLADFPPYGTVDAAGTPVGFDVSMAHVLAERLGVEAEIIHVTGPNRIPYLQTDRLDVVVAALSVTPEREEQVLFSDVYAEERTVLYARASLDIENYADLSGLSVGVLRGSVQDTHLTKNAPDAADLRRFDETSAVYQAVIAEQLDAAGIGLIVAEEIDNIKSGLYETKFVMFGTRIAAATRLHDEPLRDRLSDIITELKADGTLNEFHQEWLGISMPADL